MPALYLTLVAVLLAGFGARDQLALAGLVRRRGAVRAVLAVAGFCALLTAGLAAVAAHLLLPLLPPPARAVFAGIALAVAGIESLIVAPGRAPKEPTHSLFALFLVLLAHQLTDAARFLVFALGVGMAAPLAAGIGGGIGGLVLIVLAWLRPDIVDRPGARLARRLVGVLLLLVALTIGLRLRGLL